MQANFLLVSIFLFAVAIAIVSANQAKLLVINQPSYHVYKESSESPLKISKLNDFISAIAGFSIKNPLEWNGLKSSNSLRAPKVNILFLADSSQLNENLSQLKSIPVDQDSVLNIEHLNNLATKSDVAVKIVDQISQLGNLDQECVKNTLIYVIRVGESENLANLIQNVINKFTNECNLNKQLDLSAHLLTKANSLRLRRQASIKEEDEENNTIKNPAEFYSDQYPAMFNLIFWSSLLMALAVFVISYAMCNMDPGMDSIIYRLSSNNVKKDQ